MFRWKEKGQTIAEFALVMPILILLLFGMTFAAFYAFRSASADWGVFITGVAQIATENSVHPNQIHKWKRQALEGFAQLFEDDRKGERAREAEHEKRLNELYAEIGRLSARLSWLKKIWHPI